MTTRREDIAGDIARSLASTLKRSDCPTSLSGLLLEMDIADPCIVPDMQSYFEDWNVRLFTDLLDYYTDQFLDCSSGSKTDEASAENAMAILEDSFRNADLAKIFSASQLFEVMCNIKQKSSKWYTGRDYPDETNNSICKRIRALNELVFKRVQLAFKNLLAEKEEC